MKVTDSTISNAEATLIHVSVHSVSELRILSEKVLVKKRKVQSWDYGLVFRLPTSKE